MSRWREYFIDIHVRRRALNLYEIDAAVINYEVFNKTVKKINICKAAGHDVVAPELSRYTGETGRELLQKVINIA